MDEKEENRIPPPKKPVERVPRLWTKRHSASICGIEIFALSALFNLTERREFCHHSVQVSFCSDVIFPFKVKIDKIHGAVRD
jgi:hypothetical protein